VNLEELAQAHAGMVYEPEQFPGAILRIEEPSRVRYDALAKIQQKRVARVELEKRGIDIKSRPEGAKSTRASACMKRLRLRLTERERSTERCVPTATERRLI